MRCWVIACFTFVVTLSDNFSLVHDYGTHGNVTGGKGETCFVQSNPHGIDKS
jgi:hypothetical protein